MKCKYCDSTCSNADIHRKHIKKEHRNKCDKCYITFKDIESKEFTYVGYSSKTIIRVTLSAWWCAQHHCSCQFFSQQEDTPVQGFIQWTDTTLKYISGARSNTASNYCYTQHFNYMKKVFIPYFFLFITFINLENQFKKLGYLSYYLQQKALKSQ